MRKRLYYLDIISAFFIIEIILMHILQWAKLYDINSDLCTFFRIFPFFMPWFYFKSGMFFKDSNSLKNVIQDGIRRLVIPYIIFTFIGCFFEIIYRLLYTDQIWYKILGRPIKSILLYGSTDGNLPLWFLLSLFEIRILFYALSKSKLLHIIIVLPIFGWLQSSYIGTLPLSLSSLLSGTFFYFVGYLYKKNNYSSWNIAILSLVIFIFCYLYYPSNVDMRLNEICSGNYLIWSVSSISGIIFILKICSYIVKCDFLSKIGEDSMNYYVIHWLIILLSSVLLHVGGYKNEGKEYALVLIIANIFLLPVANYLLNKKLPSFIIGK